VRRSVGIQKERNGREAKEYCTINCGLAYHFVVGEVMKTEVDLCRLSKFEIL
jgi:hypothetical protein